MSDNTPPRKPRARNRRRPGRLLEDAPYIACELDLGSCMRDLAYWARNASPLPVRWRTLLRQTMRQLSALSTELRTQPAKIFAERNREPDMRMLPLHAIMDALGDDEELTHEP